MYKLPFVGTKGMQAEGKKSFSSCDNDSINSTASKLSMHKNSHNCTKSKPKIRIMHIISPEIIKTDVENFRDLVQRLTGKHANDEGKGSCRSKNVESQGQGKMLKMSNYDRLKDEKEGDEHQIYGGGGNLGGFGMHGFVEDFGELPLCPVRPSQLNAVFGEKPLL